MNSPSNNSTTNISDQVSKTSYLFVKRGSWDRFVDRVRHRLRMSYNSVTNVKLKQSDSPMENSGNMDLVDEVLDIFGSPVLASK